MRTRSMNMENWTPITDEPIEFEKQPVQIQDFGKIIDLFKGTCIPFLKLIKKNQKMSTCNRFVLETLGCPDWLSSKTFPHIELH